MPTYAGLARTGKSCRLRWKNYLRPDVRRGPFDMEEVALLVQLYQLLGKKWSAMAAQLPGRTGNDIKNFFHTHFKNLLEMNNAPADSCNHINNINVAADNVVPDSCNDENYQVEVDVNNNNFMETSQDDNLMSSQVVILESNPSSFAPLSGEQSSDFDVTAFWYNMLAEAERL